MDFFFRHRKNCVTVIMFHDPKLMLNLSQHIQFVLMVESTIYERTYTHTQI